MKQKLLPVLLVGVLLVATFGAVSAQTATPEAPATEDVPATEEAPTTDQATTEVTTARPFLGVSYGEAEGGVVILQVAGGSPAEAAGLQHGDLVTAVDGVAVTTANFADTISGKNVGDMVTLSITRAAEALEIAVTLGEAPTGTGFFNRRGPGMMLPDTRPFLGVVLTDDAGSVVVNEVVADSPAADAGLQVGDVITALNGEAVTTPQALVEAVQALEPGTEITLSLTRDGEAQDVTVTLGEQSGMFQVMPGRGGMDRNGGKNDNGRGGHGHGGNNNDGNDQGFSFRFGPDGMFGGRGGQELFIQPGDFNYLAEENAVEIVTLSEDSLLYEAGLRSGDKITAINGEALDLSQPFMMMPGMNLDETVTVTVQRDGAAVDVEVTSLIVPLLHMSAMGLMGEGGMGMFDFGFAIPGLPDDFGFDFELPGRPGGRGMFNMGVLSGAEIVMLDEQTAAEYGVDSTSGLYLVRVAADSPLAEAGFQAMDVITAINGQELTDNASVRAALGSLNVGDQVLITVLRDGSPVEIEYTVPERQRFDFRLPYPILPDTPATPEAEDTESQSA